MAVADQSIAQLSYVEALFGIIIAWILVALWQRVVENTAYNFFGLNPESAFHALVVAVTMTIIFLVLIRTVNSFSRDILIGETSGSTPGIAPPGIPVSESVTTSQNNSTQMKISPNVKDSQNGIILRSSQGRARRV